MMPDRETTNRTTPWMAAASQLLGDSVTVLSEPGHNVAFSGGEAHIRSWPPTATVKQVTATRALMRRVSQDVGLPHPVGNDDAVVTVGGIVFDAVMVPTGLPLNRHGVFAVPGHGEIAVPLHETADHGDILVEAARTLADVHTATRSAPELDELTSMSAQALHNGARLRWQDRRKRLGRQAASLQEIRRWLRCGNRVIPVAGERLAQAGDVASGSSVMVHGDIWPAFLIVDDPSAPKSLDSIIGWQSAARGSPVVDLALLSVRTTGWTEATVESVLGAYSDHADLPPAARRLVPVVAAVDLLDQVGKFLEVAWLDDAVASDPAQPFIRGGIKVLLRSLERLTNVLVPPEPAPRRSFGPRRPSSGDRPPRRAPQRSAANQSPRRSSGRRRRAG